MRRQELNVKVVQTLAGTMEIFEDSLVGKLALCCTTRIPLACHFCTLEYYFKHDHFHCSGNHLIYLHSGNAWYSRLIIAASFCLYV